MKKKTATQKARSKADKLYQEFGRLNYRDCLVCGKPMSCLHHYYPKSRSTPLRYDIENGIPICQGCHFKLHNSDPEIQNTINMKKGLAWIEDLEWKRHNIEVKANLQWYKTQCEILQTMIDTFKEEPFEIDEYSKNF